MDQIKILNEIEIEEVRMINKIIEKIWIKDSDENINKLNLIGATDEDINKMRVDEQRKRLEITQFAFEKTKAFAWYSEFGFVTRKQGNKFGLFKMKCKNILKKNWLVQRINDKRFYRQYYPITEASFDSFINSITFTQLATRLLESIEIKKGVGVDFQSAKKLLEQIEYSEPIENTPKNRDTLNIMLKLYCDRY